DEFLEETRKNCKLCHTYRHFKAHDSSYRQNVERQLGELARQYTDQFEELRRSPDTADADVTKAKQNKYFCMDLIPICKKCDREEPRVATELKKLS
ncbi:MAG: hypothetical protein Q7R47_01850, partial [Candidatus Diapherotrites archaeon]|nr:hypothetical protein [Candidatus Diapherotrites archaeon]